MSRPNLPKLPQREDLVFHYTDAAGFLGICQSKSLWASDIRLLNDYLEIGYFFDGVRSFLRQRQSTDPIVDLLSKSAPPYAWQFVTCFSQERDLLSQWRAYTGLQGFAIGFLRKHLAETAKENDFDFRAVNYDPAVTERRVVELVELGMESTEYGAWNANPSDIGSRQSCAGVFERIFLQEAVFHKHPSFEEEREWRLCKQISRLSREIKFRTTRRGIVPYLEFQLKPMPPVFDHHPSNFAMEVVLYPGGISNAQFDAAHMACSTLDFCGGVHRSSCPVVTS